MAEREPMMDREIMDILRDVVSIIAGMVVIFVAAGLATVALMFVARAIRGWMV